MELCTTRAALGAPPLSLSSSHRFFSNSFSFCLPLQKFPHFSGVVSHTTRSTVLRASSDETSSKFTDEKGDAFVATFEDKASSSMDDNDVTLDKVAPVSVGFNEANQTAELSDEEEASSDNEMLQPLKELLNKLNIELGVEGSSILLYGGGGVVAVWLVSAVVGAIDSIPVFPKLMEVVGLGYTLWFTSRYLLFKKNREELWSKVEELKSEVIGSSDS